MKNKNILQIAASPSWGGGEKYVYDLASELDKKGYSVFIIHRKSEILKRKMQQLQLNQKELSLKNLFDVVSIIKLALFISQNKIDVIHVHQFKDAFMSLFASFMVRGKVRIICTRHLVKPAKTNFLYRFLYNKLEAIIFVSELARNKFISTHPLIPAEKLIVIHNSVKDTIEVESSSTDIRLKYNLSKETPLLVFTGRIVSEKGINVLIEALNKCSALDFYLLILGVGDAAYEEKIKTQIRNYNLENKIEFVGFVDNIIPYIVHSDLGIFPSICQESFGLMAIEFMKYGKCVITTNNGAQKEFIENNKNGLLIPPNDSDCLAKAIALLIENRAERNRLGNEAKLKFDLDLSYDLFFKKIINVYFSS